MPITRISRCTRLRLTPSIADELAAAVERPAGVLLVDPPHQRQVLRALARRPVVATRARAAPAARTAGGRSVRLWPGSIHAAFIRCRARQLFFSATRLPSSAGRSARRAWASRPRPSSGSCRSRPSSNSSARLSSSCFFQAAIWLGWTPNWLASSVSVFSPRGRRQRHLRLDDSPKNSVASSLIPGPPDPAPPKRRNCILSGGPVFGVHYSRRRSWIPGQ